MAREIACITNDGEFCIQLAGGSVIYCTVNSGSEADAMNIVNRINTLCYLSEPTQPDGGE